MTDRMSRAIATMPKTLVEAVQPAWLSDALADESGGVEVLSVEIVEEITTVASKVRIKVTFDDARRSQTHLCLKAFWGVPGAGGLTTIREGTFYSDLGPKLAMLLPPVPAVILDRDKGEGILIMGDLISGGARFCSALEPFSIEMATKSLDQLARLHARHDLAAKTPWLPDRMADIARKPHYPLTMQQDLLDDGRAENLDERTRDASLLLAGLSKLAARNSEKAATLLHGDCHAGNVFLINESAGFTDWQLVQKGHWATDVAYHICAVLPVDVAEQAERDLLQEYLDARTRHGGTAPDWNEAWEDYRASQIYGFYHWAITRRGQPDVMKTFTERLGAGVSRHDSYTLLGL